MKTLGVDSDDDEDDSDGEDVDLMSTETDVCAPTVCHFLDCKR